MLPKAKVLPLLFLLLCTVLFGATSFVSAAPEDQGLKIHTTHAVPYGITFDRGGLHLKGGYYVSLRGVKYDDSNTRGSGFETDDLRPVLEGSLKSLSWRIEADLVGNDTPRNLYDLWVAWEAHPAFRLRAGQFRVALASEFATREFDLPFPGYGFTSYLDGRYDAGVQFEGDIGEGLLWYQATATMGRGFGLEGQRRTSPLYGLRAAAHPFARFGKGRSFLSGLFIGAGYALLSDFDDPVIITNPLESRIFKTRDLDGDSGHWLHLEIGYHHGPFMIGIEDVSGSADDVPVWRGEKEDMDELTAWVFYAAWNITGEEQCWEKGGWITPAPARNSGFWGRWELTARYSNADIDRDLFDYRLADYDVSTQECRSLGLALNWYPCRYSRISAGWVKTIADDDIDTFDGEDRDSSFFLSLQARF